MLEKRRLALSLAALLCLTACGNNNNDNGSTTLPPSSSLSCGDDTRRMGNECVPTADLARCGEGTMLVDGQCVPMEVEQGVICGPNTIEEDGKCVSNVETFCSTGTIIDTMTNRCVSTASCGAATTLIDGECLADDDVRAAEADLTEGSNENDPAFGGLPEMLVLPAAGDSTLALGTIDAPADRDADGDNDQDIDVWQFSATSGDAIRIKLLELGAGALAFEVRGPEGFYRQGPGFSPEPERTLFLPHDGEYQITIRPQLQLFVPGSGPSGSADARYRMAVENLGGLMTDRATPFDIATTTPVDGELLSLEQNLYTFEYTAPAIWSASITGIEDEDATVALIVLDGQGVVRRVLEPGSREVILNSALDNDRWLFVDWISLSSDQDDYEMRVEQLDATPIPDTLEGGARVERGDNLTLSPQETIYITAPISLVDAQQNPIDQGLVVDLDVTLTDQAVGVSYEVFSPSGERIQDIDGSPLLFLALESGDYLIKATNLSQNSPQTISNIALQSYIPTPLGVFSGSNDFGMGQVSTIPNGTAYAVFDVAGEIVADIKLENASNESAALSALSELDLLATSTVEGTGELALPPFVALTNKTRVLSVTNTGSSPFMANVTIRVTDTPTFEIEPNNRAADATPLRADETLSGSLPPGDVDYYRVSSTDAARVDVFASLLSQADPLTIEVIAPNGEIFERPPAASSVSKATFVAAPSREYLVKITNPTADSDVRYSVNASFDTAGAFEVEPNDTFSEATPLVADGDDFIAVGTNTGITDNDWFSLTLTEESFIALTLERFDDVRQPSQTLRVSAFEGDGVTPYAESSLVLMPAGTSYVRVRSASNTGVGNTYRLRARPSQSQDLGALTLDAVVRRDGSFQQGQTQETFTFDLPGGLSATHDLIVWSSAAVDLFSPTGAIIHEPVDSGQVFGSAADGSFIGTSLPGGTYQVVLRDGFVGQDWSLFVGVVASIAETEPNDTDAQVNALGELTVNSPLFFQGDLPDGDARDYGSFTLTTAQTVRFSQFQLGEQVADINMSIYEDLSAFPVATLTDTPQVTEMMLTPGTYYVEAAFVDDFSMVSREYVIAIEAF